MLFPVQKTPLIIPGCVAWYDASDLSTITQSGGSVSQWKNKANNSNTNSFALQTTAVFQPTIGTPQQGQNTISFNGSTAILALQIRPS